MNRATVLTDSHRPGSGTRRAGWTRLASRGVLAAITLVAAVSRHAAAQGPAPVAAAARPDVHAILNKLADDDPATTKQAMGDLRGAGDVRLVPFLEDFAGKRVFHAHDGKVVVKGPADGAGFTLLDPLTREPLKDANGAPLVVADAKINEIAVSGRDARLADAVRQALQLADPNPVARMEAIVKVADNGEQSVLPTLREMLKTETDDRFKKRIAESIARIELEQGARELVERYEKARGQRIRLRGEIRAAATQPAERAKLETELAAVDAALRDAVDESKHPDEAEKRKLRQSAAARLGELSSLRSSSRIREVQAAEPDPAVAAAYAPAIRNIGRWQRVVDWVGYVFSGLSAGSILILVALGLSIIFGVMGVINMAQGELVMIGAYSTYVTQLAFVRWAPPAMYDWYFACAIPLSFVVAGLVGMLIEVTVVRLLYGRPLDTLLATFGIGLVLTQGVRAYFGDNIGVKAPSFLQGGWEVVPDVVLPYNRMFGLAFCAACVALMYVVISRTKLGLLLRATTQNRAMAGALGVPTRRVDMYTFGLGAGLAGMAGCALSSIEGVTPNMGNNYIIDSFLVVVTGGVGKLAGAIWAGLGLGMMNKLLEPIFQAVWAKVLILAFVVLFLQRRPSGLFPAKGRLADV